MVELTAVFISYCTLCVQALLCIFLCFLLFNVDTIVDINKHSYTDIDVYFAICVIN